MSKPPACCRQCSFNNRHRYSNILLDRLAKSDEGRLVTDSIPKALQVASDLNLPNIETLLRVLATLPVTSCQAERSLSRL